MEINERKIINKCQKGKLEEFGKLYDKYVKKIYKFIYYKTSHKQTTEDLVSKTFFKALKNIKSFDATDDNFSAWIYKIARNNIIDHYRTQKINTNIEDVWDLPDNYPHIDIDNKLKLEKIKKYIKTLKAEHRDILIMRLWQDMSYKEISQILNKSEDSCKMTFSRVINKLRKEMPIALFIILLIK